MSSVINSSPVLSVFLGKVDEEFLLFRGAASREVALKQAALKLGKACGRIPILHVFFLVEDEVDNSFILEWRKGETKWRQRIHAIDSWMERQELVVLKKPVRMPDGFPFIMDEQLFGDLTAVFARLKRFALSASMTKTIAIGPGSFHDDKLTGFHRLFIHTFAAQLGLHSARQFLDPSPHDRDQRRQDRHCLSTSVVWISKEPLRLSSKNLEHRRQNAGSQHMRNIIKVAEWICHAGGKTTPLFVVWKTERNRPVLGRAMENQEAHILTRLPKDIIGVIDSFLFGGDNLLKFLLRKVPECGHLSWSSWSLDRLHFKVDE